MERTWIVVDILLAILNGMIPFLLLGFLMFLIGPWIILYRELQLSLPLSILFNSVYFIFWISIIFLVVRSLKSRREKKKEMFKKKREEKIDFAEELEELGGYEAAARIYDELGMYKRGGDARSKIK